MVTAENNFSDRLSVRTPFGSVLKPLLAFDRFTQIVECMFQLQKFLQKLDELLGKMSYANDPIPVLKPPLKSRVDTLLTNLIKRYTQTHTQHIHYSLFMHVRFIICWCVVSSFVVETQPSMPQGRGPLVLRTSVQFSVKVRSGSDISATLHTTCKTVYTSIASI